LQRAQENLARSISANALDPNSLYIFNDDQLCVMATANRGPTDVAGTLDGFCTRARLTELHGCLRPRYTCTP
jgi:hypothetical protein